MASVASDAARGPIVQNAHHVEHTVGAYLVFARDQWPTAMGEATRWGHLPRTGRATDEEAANAIAQSWKQCGQLFRRQCREEAESDVPHPSISDLTPNQVQILLEQLSEERHHAWCTDEYE